MRRIAPLEGCLTIPALPGPTLRVAALESEVRAWPEGSPDIAQCGIPLFFFQKNLRDIAGHEDQIRICSSEGTRLTLDPFHPFRAGLALRIRQHWPGGIDADDGVARNRQLACEQTRPATQVKNHLRH